MLEEKRPSLVDSVDLPTIWITEVVSIDLRDEVTIVTFAETVRSEGDRRERRVRARIAMSNKVLLNLAKRIDRLTEQAQALQQAAGNA